MKKKRIKALAKQLNPPSKPPVLSATSQMVITQMTPEDIRTIRETIAPQLTDSQLKLFFYECQRRGLHPMSQLIHPVVRDGKLTMQTSIHHIRAMCEMNNEYSGMDEPKYEMGNNEIPISATTTVYRMLQGVKTAFTATAYYKEYVPYTKKGEVFPLWQKMPRVMLAKCSEAQARRMAFPKATSGLYVGEEMETDTKQRTVTPMQIPPTDQPATQPPNEKEVGEPPVITSVEKTLFLQEMQHVVDTRGIALEDIRDFAKSLLAKKGIKSLALMPSDLFSSSLEAIQNYKKEQKTNA